LNDDHPVKLLVQQAPTEAVVRMRRTRDASALLGLSDNFHQRFPNGEIEQEKGPDYFEGARRVFRSEARRVVKLGLGFSNTCLDLFGFYWR
jgi:hypothetical protein